MENSIPQNLKEHLKDLQEAQDKAQSQPTLKEQLNELRVKFPNDKDFGSEVAKLLEETNKLISCCLCNKDIEVHPLTKWQYGHNPSPLGKDEKDRCCDTCNDVYVIPTRLGQMMGEGITKVFSTPTTKKK